MSEVSNIDPVKYGVLWQKVQDYERRFDAMERKMDKMEEQLTQLIALANKSKGGFWVGMTIASTLGGVATWAVNQWRGH